jgi:putative ribosome biogenesis GTPase RsgA
MKSVEEIISAIHSLNMAQLREVTSAVGLRREWLTRQHMRSFVVGDRVRFDAGRRGVVSGVLTKVNRKTVSVHADSGMTWRVAVSLIERETVE